MDNITIRTSDNSEVRVTEYVPEYDMLVCEFYEFCSGRWYRLFSENWDRLTFIDTFCEIH